jgi:hypothetical protein
VSIDYERDRIQRDVEFYLWCAMNGEISRCQAARIMDVIRAGDVPRLAIDFNDCDMPEYRGSLNGHPTELISEGYRDP